MAWESESRRKMSNTEKGEQIGSFPVTGAERGSFPQVEKGEGTVSVASKVNEMEKQEDGQLRQPFSGDRVKPTAPLEDRQPLVKKNHQQHF